MLIAEWCQRPVLWHHLRWEGISAMSDLVLTYVCNAGILLSWKGYTAAIDVFANDPDGIYMDTPSHWKEKIFGLAAAGRLPFLAVSHEHADHYCREDVLRTVEESRKNAHLTGILTTRPVAEDLLEHSCVNYRNILRQNMLVLPETEEGCTFDFSFGNSSDAAQLHVQALNVRHDGKQYASVQNILLLAEFRTEGQAVKIVVPADASPTPELYRRIARWSREIDWLIIPFPCIGKTSARRALAGALTVHHIAAYHFPAAGRDEQGWYAHTEALCREADDGLPYPVFLREPGSSIAIFRISSVQTLKNVII